MTITSSPPVLAVVSPKGGNGKTTIAVNLAAALARRTPTVLIDLDVHFGDVEYALRLHPLVRLDDVLIRYQTSTKTDVDSLLALHGESLGVLCAPSEPIAADHLSPADTLALVDRYISLSRPVVIDTGAGIDEFSIGAIERATHTVLVTTTDVPSVQAGRKLLDTLGAIAVDPGNLHLVVNRSTSDTGLGVNDVEAVLGLSASMLVPEDPRVASSMNLGSPIVDTHPNVPAARSFQRLADDMLGHSTHREHHRFALTGRNS